jgi:hypothetical protein
LGLWRDAPRGVRNLPRRANSLGFSYLAAVETLNIVPTSNNVD